jgi:hypothetical protein
MMKAILEASLSVLPHPDTAGRLIEHFHRAGLGQPMVLCEVPVAGGTNSVAYAWVAETLRSVMRQLQTIGVLTAEIGIDTLEDLRIGGRYSPSNNDMQTTPIGADQ